MADLVEVGGPADRPDLVGVVQETQARLRQAVTTRGSGCSRSDGGNPAKRPASSRCPRRCVCGERSPRQPGRGEGGGERQVYRISARLHDSEALFSRLARL